MALTPDSYLVYANLFLIFNLDTTLKNYKNFLDKMRGLPRSEPNLGVLESENIANIVLKYKRRTIILKMNTHDFYIMGFVSDDGTLWEFRRQNDPARLRGSRAVGIGLNYPPLVGLNISKVTILNAFGNLAEMEQGDRIAYEAAILCLVFCEGARFLWAGQKFRRCVSSKTKSVIVDEWLSDMIKDWSVLTRLAKECHEEHIELTKKERKIMKNHLYKFFKKVGTEHRKSQARIAKLLIKVEHRPRNSP